MSPLNDFLFLKHGLWDIINKIKINVPEKILSIQMEMFTLQ
jgi:hypothetical protein